MDDPQGSSEPPPTTPLVVDYRTPGTVGEVDFLRAMWRRTPRWIAAAALTTICALAGLIGRRTRYHFDIGFITANLIWAGSAWYVFARCRIEQTGWLLRRIKTLASVTCAVAAPVLFCRDALGHSPLNLLKAYGWGSRAFGADGRAMFVLFASLLVTVGLIDVTQVVLAIRTKSVRRHREGGTMRDATQSL